MLRIEDEMLIQLGKSFLLLNLEQSYLTLIPLITIIKHLLTKLLLLNLVTKTI